MRNFLSNILFGSALGFLFHGQPQHMDGNVAAKLPVRSAVQVEIDLHKPFLRLYKSNQLFKIYPVALGKVNSQSPIGSWHIVDKQKGWGAGFGSRWLGLDVPWGTYGIHGTNRPHLIGGYVSQGCIRMRNEDVEQLYDLLPLGTSVEIKGNPLEHLRVLKDGDIGADVQWVQRRLTENGYYFLKCDGKFDPGLQFSLALFELAKGIPMDGVVDEEDYRALGVTRSGSIARTTDGMTNFLFINEP